MLARTTAQALVGLEVVPIAVEIDAAPGLPALSIIGLPDQAVREARERVRAAILNSQYRLPSQRLTVNLAPADLKKEGGMFDLAIALGVLAASDQLDPARLAAATVVGELALDGSVRPIAGALPIALALQRRAARRLSSARPKLLLPAANAWEASGIRGISLLPAASLCEAVELLTGARLPQVPRAHATPRPRPAFPPGDFADVIGQRFAKRALEVAAAGGHHVLLVGPPGCGKTMLAQRFCTIQPPPTTDEALEIRSIHSIAGTAASEGIQALRPFRAPHHTSSAEALLGGGPSLRPGEASLAHHGVLFLDELPEFHRDAIEGLRQPLERGEIHLARARRTLRFPARFQLIAAMNPCPCGMLTDPRGRCRCPATIVHRYLAKLSGPLLDRLDLHVALPPVPTDQLTTPASAEPSAAIRARVLAARHRQATRSRLARSMCNAHLRQSELARVCPMTPDASTLLREALRELGLSARSYTKVVRIARTIADLAGEDLLQRPHLAEAIQYRMLDRELWAFR